ncbi:MAG: hypothetical protein HYT06_00685 [Candidatus Levybacteria bacterium]|nr:hypothetical protein [Candidatus Levybacteria bacterium]
MDNTQNPNNNNVDNSNLPVQNSSSGQYQNGLSSSINKEVEKPVSDFVAHSETQPVLDREVETVGVKVASEKPQLTQEHEQIGVKHSLENNFPTIEPTGTVQLMDESQAEDVINKYKGNSDPLEHVEKAYFLPSIFGFATLIVKLIKENAQKAHAKITGRSI